MRFCTHCGKEISDDAVICVGCGCAVKSISQEAAVNTDGLLEKLSQRINTNGIIWLVIAVCQILIGIFVNWFVLVVGVLNIVSAIKDMNYSKTIFDNPVGIVRNFERLASPIIVLVYNFFIGGVIGVIGSLYYFIALRGFVMEQKEAFLEIEYNHLSL